MTRALHLSFAIASAMCALVLFSSSASAQGASCTPYETQAECHTRLKCKADEELEACQKRLRSGGGNSNNNRDNDRGDSGRGDNDRGDNGRRDNDRGRDRGRDDNDRGSRRGGGDNDRGGRRRGRGRRSGGSRSFEANKTFGLGLELGEPTGLTGKYFFSDRAALDFGLGYIYEHYYYGDGLHLYADLLVHPVSLASNPTFELPFYVGGGIRFWDFDYCYQGRCGYGASAVGLRIPLGIAFDFNNAPLDIFIQIVPTIDFVSGDYYDRYDRSYITFDFSVGLRFWFK